MEKGKIDIENNLPNDKECHYEWDENEKCCEEYFKWKCDEWVKNYERKYNECCNDICREFYSKKIKECKEYFAMECQKCSEKHCCEGPQGPPGPIGPIGPVEPTI